MWERVLYFLKIAQAVTFQVTVFEEKYNLADFTELDFKGGGEYFDLEQHSQPRLSSAIPWEVTRSSGLILKGRRGGWRIGNDWGDCCSSLVAPREGVG